MIPKKIHYCWLSGEEYPEIIKKCLKSWQEVMSDYEFVLWDKKRFNVNSVPWVKEAYEAKKYAFATDYIRLFALYNEGGIYLDTDVLVGKRFDSLLKYNFFTSLEFFQKRNPNEMIRKNTSTKTTGNAIEITPNSYGFQLAVMGASPKNELIKACMNWYETNKFKLSDGTTRDRFSVGIGPDICSSIAQKFGFKYDVNIQQTFGDNMVVLPAEYFPNGGGGATKNTFAVHYCQGSWVPKFSMYFLYRLFAHNKFLRKLLGKKITFESVKKLITDKS